MQILSYTAVVGITYVDDSIHSLITELLSHEYCTLYPACTVSHDTGVTGFLANSILY